MNNKEIEKLALKAMDCTPDHILSATGEHGKEMFIKGYKAAKGMTR